MQGLVEGQIGMSLPGNQLVGETPGPGTNGSTCSTLVTSSVLPRAPQAPLACPAQSLAPARHSLPLPHCPSSSIQLRLKH